MPWSHCRLRTAPWWLGHVAKITAANSQQGEGYSGSTGWHNSVRSRWYLFPETEQGEDRTRPERTGRLRLELQKSNLGRADQGIAWRWDDHAHLFLPEEAPSAFDKAYQQREERRGITLAFDAAERAGQAVPAATTGPRTAFNVLSARPEFPISMRSGKPAVRRFWRHIEEMRALAHVREESIARKDRHYVRVLQLTPAGLRACGE